MMLRRFVDRMNNKVEYSITITGGWIAEFDEDVPLEVIREQVRKDIIENFDSSMIDSVDIEEL